MMTLKQELAALREQGVIVNAPPTLRDQVATLRKDGLVREASEAEVLTECQKRDINVLATVAAAANRMRDHKPGCTCPAIWCSAMRAAEV